MTHCISAQTNTCNVVANSRFTFGCKRKISDVLYSIILSGIYSSTMARVHSILGFLGTAEANFAPFLTSGSVQTVFEL